VNFVVWCGHALITCAAGQIGWFSDGRYAIAISVLTDARL